MTFDESDLLPLSALQHLLFCERQCALIHIEQLWVENVLTAQGRQEHEKADSGFGESRRDLRIARGLSLRSLRLGLSGKADVVELHRAKEGQPGCLIPIVPGRWRPFPVEYKHGRPKENDCDRVQLCAQALCLEEMLDVLIPDGALFYQSIRRRERIQFDAVLRKTTEDTIERLQVLFRSGITPPAVYDQRCKRCSLLDVCLPRRTDGQHSVKGYFQEMISQEV